MAAIKPRQNKKGQIFEMLVFLHAFICCLLLIKMKDIQKMSITTKSLNLLILSELWYSYNCCLAMIGGFFLLICNILHILMHLHLNRKLLQGENWKTCLPLNCCLTIIGSSLLICINKAFYLA